MMADLDWSPVVQYLRDEMNECLAKKAGAASRIQKNIEQNIATTAEQLRKCLEEREDRKMKIEVTESQLDTIIYGLDAFELAVKKDLNALNAIKGTKWEAGWEPCTLESEGRELKKDLEAIRAIRKELVDAYNREEGEE